MKERVVVIGGGFAGLNFIKHIDNGRYDVTLIDRNNFHSFPPLFYQIASSGLEPASISFPFRREIRRMRKRPDYHMGDVKAIDMAHKEVITTRDRIPYDKLVIAAGTTNNFFNLTDLYKHVYTIKTTGQAIRCRNEILNRLELACNCKDADERRRMLSFAVIGGGPSGVEVAGAIGEMKRYIVPREYPEINPDEMTITLVEGSGKLLGNMSPKASEYTLKSMNDLNVDVMLNKTLTAYDDNGTVTFADGTTLHAEMVIWTAGVTSVSFELQGGQLPIGHAGRIMVDEYNRVQGTDDIYAIGDIALHTDDRYPRGCPQLAQVAIQQARTLADNLNHGSMRKAFRYRDKGSMATIGRNRAVADIGKIHLTGFFAWAAWMFVHLISLLGMRNKLVVLTNWVWAYFSYPTSLRLLFRASRYPLRDHS